jgi:hypothetical protein
MVTVGCKLPNGLILELNHVKVELNGSNKAAIIGADTGYTDVDDDFWTAWSKAYSDYTPLTTGSVFVAKDRKSAEAIGSERKKLKTGFEPMEQKAPGIDKAD